MKNFITNLISYYIIMSILILTIATSLVLSWKGSLVILLGALALYVINREVEIKVKYFPGNQLKIHKVKKGDWIDLRAAETIKLNKGETTLIRLGVGMILPDGYEAHILPRSSTLNTFGILCTNSMGVIDSSYNGDADEWHFPAMAIRDTIINQGDRICQFRIVQNQPNIKFKTVERLKKYSRGGLGSTGIR